jgi:hypothetical protein
MKFPKWVNKSGLSKEEKAVNRLKYIMGRTAIEFDRSGSVQALCAKVGVSHSTVSQYVNKGGFSESMAKGFEKAFGPEFMTKGFLQDPLSIPVDGK